MAFTQSTINWDMVTSSCRFDYIPKLQDNIFFTNAFLQFIQSRVKDKQIGPMILARLLIGMEGGGGDWYAGTDQHDTTIRNPITSATFFGKNAIVPAAIDETEELEATTPEKVADLIEDKMQIMEETMRYLLCAALFNAGTNQKALTGLQQAIPTELTNAYVAASTYGGILSGGSAVASDANGFWQPNPVNLGTGAPFTAGGTGGNFMQAVGDNPMGKLFAKAFLRCGRQPNLIVSNIGAWTDYHNALVKNERYDRALKNIKMAESGFDSLMYRGATWITDPLAPRTSGSVETVYALDTNCFDVYWDPRRKFYMTPWREPYNQSTRVSYLKNRLELIFRERRSSGALAVTAAL